MGGLARRATEVASIRQEGGAFLLLDAGMALPRRKEQQALKAGVILDVMDYLRYDAFNLGRNEFLLGPEFLEAARNRISVPIVTSNLAYAEDNERTWGKPYLVKGVGTTQVAILGIVPENILSGGIPAFPGIVVISPEKALERLIPPIRKRGADVVIVLSSCGYLETIDLVEKVPGIDFAVTSGRLASTMIKTEKPPVFQAGMKGEKLGVIKVSVGESGGVTCEHSLVGLYADIADNSEVIEIIKKAQSQP